MNEGTPEKESNPLHGLSVFTNGMTDAEISTTQRGAMATEVRYPESDYVNPLTLPVSLVQPSHYVTGQDYTDAERLAEIAESMRTHGWRGAPLVVLPDYAISYSGTHRLAAAQAVELEEIPTVRLHDLFEAVGLDLDVICDKWDLGLISDRVEILNHLPDDVRQAYTLDDIG
ncbi:ParB N-terminal domain-containing protein [Streptomyces sp. NPDC000927]|uniref:ParB N-terminal domain-containing protein n=1 Tax=Streptomyces sp. NPDC000927 TaxID=3154371 RepID=UPI0033170B3D